MKVQRASLLRQALAGAWLIFTLSLIVWWLIFGFRQVERIAALDHAAASQMARYQRMLLWEGATLVMLLAGGAAALSYYMVREMRERAAVQKFFATFTHELKTPLASLRLQAEALAESSKDKAQSTLLERLMSDAARLAMQLDNCLFLANLSAQRLCRERVQLSEVCAALHSQWPALSMVLKQDCLLQVDRRAFESILNNLMRNSLTHGRASKVEISPAACGAGKVQITFRDNGTGFKGDSRRLGMLFERFYAGSGSGIGLFLVKRLAQAMGGALKIPAVENGFEALLILPGEVVIAH